MKRIFSIFLFFLSAIALSAQDRVDTLRAKLFDQTGHGVMVASHRGDWRNFCENTLEGVMSAASMGVDIVEIDIQKTRDGQLIVMHDATLNLTTTGKGNVSDWTVDSIKTLRIKNGCAIRTKQRVPTLEEVLVAMKGKVLLNLDKADRYFDDIYPLLIKTGTARQIVMKGRMPAGEVKERFGQYLDEVIYMPIVDLDKSDAAEAISSFVAELHPVAFELLFKTDDNRLPLQLANTLQGVSQIWYNTLWDTLVGGHDDDATLTDIDNGWGYCIDRLGCRIIQTDRPQMLLDYLRSRGLHE